MRIVTWNINGIRTIPHYHPWNGMKTHEEMLNHLQADIICFQETKSSRLGLPKGFTLPSPAAYASFYSFPHKKSGYSGVATYTRTGVAVPYKAEEGLCGTVPLPSLPANTTTSGPVLDESKVSLPPAYPPARLPPDTRAQMGVTLDELDAEGRTLVVDLGLFVLINVYCPNDGTGSEDRLNYKLAFHEVLESRVRGLIDEGREVVLVGDLNACAAVIDHVEGDIMERKARAAAAAAAAAAERVHVVRGAGEDSDGEPKEEEGGFYGPPYRRWLRDFLIPTDEKGDLVVVPPEDCLASTRPRRLGAGAGEPCMVDVVRAFWPGRKGMYTCWNTKLSARQTNYGTRIDYILVTPGLLPWVKFADIQPEVRGSDHCPVYVDLLDEVEVELVENDALMEVDADPKGTHSATATRRVLRLADVLRIPPEILIPHLKSNSTRETTRTTTHSGAPLRSLYRLVQDLKASGVLKLDGTSAPPPPPRLAAQYWEEFSGKQKRLDGFFIRKKGVGGGSLTATPSENSGVETARVDDDGSPLEQLPPISHVVDIVLEEEKTIRAPSPLSASPMLTMSSARKGTETETIDMDGLPMHTSAKANRVHENPPKVKGFPADDRRTNTKEGKTKRKATDMGGKSKATAPQKEGGDKGKSGQARLSHFFVKPSAPAPTQNCDNERGVNMDLRQDTGKSTGKRTRTSSPVGLTLTSDDEEASPSLHAPSQLDPLLSQGVSSQPDTGGAISGREDYTEDEAMQVESAFASSGDDAAFEYNGILIIPHKFSMPGGGNPHPMHTQAVYHTPSQSQSQSHSQSQSQSQPRVHSDRSYTSTPTNTPPTTAPTTPAAPAWSTLLARIEPPLCSAHGEATRQCTVMKPGPNKGKQFFICSRPVGPGYDKGRSERLREDVNPEYRCNYFRWAADAKKDMMRRKTREDQEVEDASQGSNKRWKA